MVYGLFGFVFGLFIPYMSRRFAKFMPATLGYALYRLLKPVKKVRAEKRKANWLYAKMMSQYRWRSVMYGLLTAALSYGAFWEWGSELIWWKLVFVWFLLLLTEIDIRIQILPDILTIPFLLLGFAFSIYTGLWTMPLDAVNGSLIGYFVPVLASLFFVSKGNDAFGGGDIKLLSALGAWFGVEHLMLVLVEACVLFALHAAIVRRRQGAFGPAIAIAAIAMAYYLY